MPQPTPTGFVVEVSQWRRLQRRIETIGDEPSPGWLIALATTCIGIAASALIAVLVSLTTAEGQLAAGVQPALLAICVAASLLSAILVLLYRSLRKRMPNVSDDICDEMRAIEAPWCGAGEAKPPDRSAQ